MNTSTECKTDREESNDVCINGIYYNMKWDGKIEW